MNLNKKVIIGVTLAILFIIFTVMIRDTKIIWIQTRVLGIITYFSFASVVLLGELRHMYKNKADFPLFRFHKPLAIFSVSLVFMHLLSAVLDNYGRGKLLSFFSYLGFSFSDAWLSALSYGVLSFYLFMVVGYTSRTSTIQKIGFKYWKNIHVLSYLGFLLAYVHAINIGTDVNSGFLAVGLRPIFQFSFFSFLALMLARMFAFKPDTDQIARYSAVVFFVLLIFGSMFMVQDFVDRSSEISIKSTEASFLEQDLLKIGEILQNQQTLLGGGNDP